MQTLGINSREDLRRILRQSYTSAPRSVRPHRLASEQ